MWSLFALGYIAAGNKSSDASYNADLMLLEYKNRFSKTGWERLTNSDDTTSHRATNNQ